jgi:uncharacterized membrane protein YjjP (DUF1212 family)
MASQSACSSAEPVGSAEREGASFLLALGRALQASGAPAHRLERVLGLLATRLGIEGTFFVTPTALYTSFGNGLDQRTHLQRADVGEPDLHRLCALDEVAAEVADGRLGAAAGLLRVQELEAAPPRWSAAWTIPAFSVASFAVARLFGGDLPEMLVAALGGLLVGLLVFGASRVERLARLLMPLSAAGVALLAALAPAVLGPVSGFVITVAGLIILLPGLSLTVAMAELAMGHLVSGTSRLAGVLVVLVQLGVGVALGLKLGNGLIAPVLGQSGTPAAWTAWPALVLAVAALVPLMQVRLRDAGWIALGCALSYFGARGGSLLLGPELGAFAGSVLLGLGGNAFARLAHRPASLVTTPGILLLVPGSVGFRSLNALLEQDVVGGLETAFQMALIAGLLVTGQLVANLIVQPRKAL